VPYSASRGTKSGLRARHSASRSRGSLNHQVLHI
jgi:hypothetical protein